MRGSTLLLFCYLAGGCLLVNSEQSLDISLEKTQEGETNVCFTYSNCDISESCLEPTKKCVKLDDDFFKNLWERIIETIGSRPDLIALIMNRFPNDVGFNPPDSSEFFDYFSNVDPGFNAMMKMAKMADPVTDESLQGSTELPSTAGSYRTTIPNFKNPGKSRYSRPTIVYTSTYRTPYSRPYSRFRYTTSSPNVKDSNRKENMFASVDEINGEFFTGNEQFITNPYPIDGWNKRNKRKMGRKGGRWNDRNGRDYVPWDWRTEEPEAADPSTAGMYDYGKRGPWKYRPGKDESGSNVYPGMIGNAAPWKTFRPPPMDEEDVSNGGQPMMDGPWSYGKYKPWMMNKPSMGGPPMGGMGEPEVGGPWMMDGQWVDPKDAPWMMKKPGKYGPPMGGMDGFGKRRPPMNGEKDRFGKGRPPMVGGGDESQDGGPPTMGSSLATTLSTVADGTNDLVTEEGTTVM